MIALFQFLIYPGILWVGVILTLIVPVLERCKSWSAWFHSLRRSSFAAQLSLLLAAATIALLPWPRIPFAPVFTFDLWRIWALSEASFLISLLPGLAAQDRATHATAVRTAQLGVAGRTTLWVAVLAASGSTSLVALALAGAAVLIALPIAAGWIAANDASEPIIKGMHGTLLIAIVVSFMIDAAAIAWWLRIGLSLGVMAALACMGWWLQLRRVAWQIETALRNCLFIALPLALLALILR